MKISLIISDSFYFIKQTINSIFSDDSEIIKINFNNVELSDLLYELSTPSLFEENKKIVVENTEELFSKGFESDEFENYLNNPSDLSEVIFIT